jgi:hypothetical protein
MRAPLTSIGLVLAGAAAADPAVVEEVAARPTGDGWTFEVTLSHGDTGWDDHADGWRVVGADGTVFGTRDLLHPHVDEQPFTRSLADVAIPAGIARVFIEARTTVEGWGAARYPVDLPD